MSVQESRIIQIKLLFTRNKWIFFQERRKNRDFSDEMLKMVNIRILVDADACPNGIKDILFRVAQRLQIETILVANQSLKIPRSAWISCKVVRHGFDEADNWIIAQVEVGDLVISADIPLAASAIEKGATVISPRGELLTTENIKQRLSMRNLMEEIRGSGENIGGPSVFSQADQRNFANQLDRLLNKCK